MGKGQYKNYKSFAKERAYKTSRPMTPPRILAFKTRSIISYSSLKRPKHDSALPGVDDNPIIGGAAGQATYEHISRNIVNNDDKYGQGRRCILPSVEEIITGDVIGKPFNQTITNDVIKPTNIKPFKQNQPRNDTGRKEGSGSVEIPISNPQQQTAETRQYNQYKTGSNDKQRGKRPNRRRGGNTKDIVSIRAGENQPHTGGARDSTNFPAITRYPSGPELTVDLPYRGSYRANKKPAHLLPKKNKNEFKERIGREAARQSKHVLRNVGMISFVTTRNAVKSIRYSTYLNKQIKLKTITQPQAKLMKLRRKRANIAEAGTTIKRSIKAQAVRGVESFYGSEDDGMQALTLPKEIYFKTRRYVRMAKRTVKTAKATYRVTKKTVHFTENTARVVGRAAKSVLTNPIVIKGSLALLGVVFTLTILLSVVSAVTTIVPTTTLKSEDAELTKTYKHITELDAKLMQEIINIPDQAVHADIDEFHFYVNGSATAQEGILIITDADSVLAFYDVHYNDYKFNSLIKGVFGGATIQSDLDGLHKQLYSYETHRWEEEIIHETTTTNEQGEEVTTTTTEIIYHLDINVRAIDFDSYLAQNESTLLPPDQKERLETLEEVGVYIAKKDLGKPFEGEEDLISLRFGWFFNPFTKVLSDHQGVDIAKPNGTNVLCVLQGSVKQAEGDTVIVEQGKRQVIYKNLGSIAASAGQTIKIGEAIGTVGASGGDITSPHVHIEYSYDGFHLCPSIFLDGVKTDVSQIDYGSLLNGGGDGSGNPGGYTPPPFPEGPGSNDIVAVAASQIGNVGGQPYWSYYGFGSRTAWCAIFVSWCKEKSGQRDAFPTFFYCPTGADNFRSRGQYQPRSSGYIPRPGDIIFFDYVPRNGVGQNGSDHVGIVESCDGTYVYTIEGNTKNSVARRRYELNRPSILGYGTPNYQ